MTASVLVGRGVYSPYLEQVFP